MTVVSVAEAAHRLGIDPKTLRRWLSEAQLSLQRHPHDGRKHGISSQHLHTLARLHQRRLAPLPGEEQPLPASLLGLPEQVSALQAQLAALQQHVMDLTRLLTPPSPEPARSSAPLKSPRTPRHPRRSASSAAATVPRKPVHVIARVEYGEQGHYVVICPKQGVLPFEPDTPEWFAWVREQDSFRFVGQGGHFTAHHEWRVPKGAWRAHRKIRNHNYIVRLAPNHELTLAVLERAAAALQAHLS